MDSEKLRKKCLENCESVWEIVRRSDVCERGCGVGRKISEIFFWEKMCPNAPIGERNLIIGINVSKI